MYFKFTNNFRLTFFRHTHMFAPPNFLHPHSPSNRRRNVLHSEGTSFSTIPFLSILIQRYPLNFMFTFLCVELCLHFLLFHAVYLLKYSFSFLSSCSISSMISSLPANFFSSR